MHRLILMGSLLCLLNASPGLALSKIEGTDLASDRPLSLDLTAGNKLKVAVFLSSRCPCSASHQPVLADLSKTYPEASFVGIAANTEESSGELRQFFRANPLPFPVIHDPGQRYANEWKAIKTPHVFVFSKKGEILYQGGVDDSHEASGASKQYLKLALDNIRAGKAPDPKQTRAMGCVIRR